MFCPKCSQQQASEEMQFCSRCGFGLRTVTLLLRHNGVMPTNEKNPTDQTFRGRMIRESVGLTIIAWLVVIAATFLFDLGGPFETAAKIAALIFFILGFIGLLRFLYAFLFVKNVTVEPTALSNAKLVSRSTLEPGNRASLPPQRATPISDYSKPGTTKEMQPVPSVTENTTRLLEEEPATLNKDAAS